MVRAKPYAYGADEYVNLELYLAWRGRGLPVGDAGRAQLRAERPAHRSTPPSSHRRGEPASASSPFFRERRRGIVPPLPARATPRTAGDGHEMPTVGDTVNRMLSADETSYSSPPPRPGSAASRAAWLRAAAQAGHRPSRSILAFEPLGQVTLLHLCDLHAQLVPLYYREPSVNLGRRRGHSDCRRTSPAGTSCRGSASSREQRPRPTP